MDIGTWIYVICTLTVTSIVWMIPDVIFVQIAATIIILIQFAFIYYYAEKLSRAKV